MKLTLLYFASLRERLECPMERVEMPDTTGNVAAVVAHTARTEAANGTRPFRRAGRGASP